MKNFPEALLAQIKGAFRLSDYVSKTVPLKRVGKEYQALSPFVREKTPSFYVNDEKAFYHCFASGRHGDIIAWLVEHEGMTFVDAVKRLAEEAGIPLPERDERAQEADSRRQNLENVLKTAQRYFEQSLQGTDHAREYLLRRGLPEAEWSRFGIGYAPSDRAGLVSTLLAWGFDHDAAVAAGVAIRTEDNPRPYDRYRDRIIFPIHNAAGRLISFGGRALDPAQKAKYLNGPDTELFDKGRNLYGLNLSRAALSVGDLGPLLVVEGYMDVIGCLRAGIAACAPMGTSLTEAQLELLWRTHGEPTFCFDGDAAGRRAASRVMDIALPKLSPTRSMRFARLEGGKDPDEVLKNRGAEALRLQVQRSMPLVDALYQREVVAGPLDTPEQRAGLRERLRKVVQSIGDRDLSREYADAFKAKMTAIWKPNGRQTGADPAAVDSAKALHAALTPRLRALAYWVVKDPARAAENIEWVEGGLGHPELDALVEHVVAWLMCHDPDPELLAQNLHRSGLGPLAAQLGDPHDSLADPGSWLQAWRQRGEYRRLDAEMQQIKGRISGPADMQNFLALKAQRDRAKAAS